MMIERLRSFILAASGLVVLLGLGFWFFISQGDNDLFQANGSLKPTDFESLDYHAGLDRPAFLLCDAVLCPTALPDGAAPHFSMTTRQAQRQIAAIIDKNPSARLIHFNPSLNQFDMSERLPGAPFPMVLSLRITETDLGQIAIAFYSYQPVGDSLKQDHSEQIARFIADLKSFEPSLPSL